MNAATVAVELQRIIPGLDCRAVNRRWLRVVDGKSARYLDCVSVGVNKLARLHFDRYARSASAVADAWDAFQGSTASVQFADLPVSAKRAAVAKFGANGAATWERS